MSMHFKHWCIHFIEMDMVAQQTTLTSIKFHALNIFIPFDRLLSAVYSVGGGTEKWNQF